MVRRNCYKNRGGRRTCEKESDRQRGGVADGDMLIYELQGFSLTILSFTENGGWGELKRKYNSRKQEDKMQNL